MEGATVQGTSLRMDRKGTSLGIRLGTLEVLAWARSGEIDDIFPTSGIWSGSAHLEHPTILEMASSDPGTSLWWFCHLQSLGYWASYLPFLCLSFLIYKMGIMLPL